MFVSQKAQLGKYLEWMMLIDGLAISPNLVSSALSLPVLARSRRRRHRGERRSLEMAIGAPRASRIAWLLIASSLLSIWEYVRRTVTIDGSTVVVRRMFGSRRLVAPCDMWVESRQLRRSLLETGIFQRRPNYAEVVPVRIALQSGNDPLTMIALVAYVPSVRDPMIHALTAALRPSAKSEPLRTLVDQTEPERRFRLGLRMGAWLCFGVVAGSGFNKLGAAIGIVIVVALGSAGRLYGKRQDQ